MTRENLSAGGSCRWRSCRTGCEASGSVGRKSQTVVH
nr:MAG TPA: Na+ channel auxiliary subunit TipE [Caudoviricetes sp.]